MKAVSRLRLTWLDRLLPALVAVAVPAGTYWVDPDTLPFVASNGKPLRVTF